jgi:hypothetical protein
MPVYIVATNPCALGRTFAPEVLPDRGVTILSAYSVQWHEPWPVQPGAYGIYTWRLWGKAAQAPARNHAKVIQALKAIARHPYKGRYNRKWHAVIDKYTEAFRYSVKACRKY